MEKECKEKKVLEQEAAEEIRDVRVECEKEDIDERVLEDEVSGGSNFLVASTVDITVLEEAVSVGDGMKKTPGYARFYPLGH